MAIYISDLARIYPFALKGIILVLYDPEKTNRPWKLVGHEKHSTGSEAIQHERFLKTGQQKERLKKRFDKY